MRPAQRSDTFIFLGIAALAFSIRLIYLNQIKTSPFFEPLQFGLDDYLYDTWAQAIAKGDLLGQGVFYGLPLYPYLLGLVYWLFGHNIFAAKLLQFLVGSLSCGLVYLIAKTVFNKPVGILASLMLAFYAMSIYLEGLFVSAFLAIFLNCLLMLLLLSIMDSPSRPKWLGAGLLIGLSALASGSVLLFVPLVIVWSFTCFKDTPTTRLTSYTVLLLLGMVFIIAPVTIRNYVVGRDFVPITAHGGITFYGGNNPLSRGLFRLPRNLGTGVIDVRSNSKALAERGTGRTLKPSEVSQFWFAQGFAFIKSDPRRFAKYTLKKAVLFWNAHEIPDILPLFFFKQYAPLLRLPLVTFSIVCPLALLGMILCAKKDCRGRSLLYLMVLSVFVSTLIYFVNTRYRVQALPYLVIFAAFSVQWLYDAARQRRFKQFALALVGAAILTVVVHVRVVKFSPAQAYNNLGVMLSQQRQEKEAIESYEKALEMDPTYTSPHVNLGGLHYNARRYDVAIEHFARALEMSPELIAAHNAIGAAYLAVGQRRRALLHWNKSLQLDPSQRAVEDFVRRYSYQK